MKKYSSILPAIYILTTTACVLYALSTADHKGRIVILQIPIALQAALVDQIGLGKLLEQMSWVTAYVALGIPTIGALYGIGHLIEKLRNTK